MRRFALFFLICFGLIGGLIWQTPLSFVLRQSGLASAGVSWTQARGSIWNGQVTDLSVQQRRIGAFDLKLRPYSLLSGSLAYDAKWIGAFGQGTGRISANTQRFISEDVSLSISLSDIPDLIEELKQVDGTFRMNEAKVQWERFDGCEAASGRLQTDLVRLLGHRMQKDWPELTGNLSCDNGELVATLSGVSAQDETFDIELYIAPQMPVRYNANISGVSPDIQNALALYGFKFENGAYTLYGDSLGGNAH